MRPGLWVLAFLVYAALVLATDFALSRSLYARPRPGFDAAVGMVRT